MDEYTSAGVLADIAGVSRQAVEKALQLIVKGKRTTWRGAELTIRTIPGRGGRSGLRYEVLVSSLPADLQYRYREQRASEFDPDVLCIDGLAGDMRECLARILAPALAHPKRSKARGQAIAKLAGDQHWTPDGPRLFSERTIRNLIARFEGKGIAGLQKKARRDRGVHRVLISTAWDAAVDFDLETRMAIRDQTREAVRRFWRSGYVLSKVIRYGSEELLRATQTAGFVGSHRELRRVCRLPRAFVERDKHLRKVDRYERDRKAHEDAKPRIRRTRAGLEPMQLVVGDVHHLDIYVRRDDGRLATPKMVGWLDMANMRIFGDVFLPEVNPATNRSRSMTNSHVIASFIRMTQHPEWGMPRMLYLDNGSEYNWADFINDALKLGSLGVGEIASRDSPIIRAKPYNAPAKIIEGVFGILERNYFSEIPGYIGGNRLAAKTANVGRAPAPFPGDLAALRALIEAHLRIYSSQPQRGELAGRSPDEAFAAASEWTCTAVDPTALRVAFSTEETRQVTQGAISVAGRYWTCPELQAYLGDRVTVLLPKYEDWSVLPIKDDLGELLGFAEPDAAFDALDPEGARESARRSKRFERQLRQIGKAVQRVDAIGQAMKSAVLVPSRAPPPTGAVVSLSDEAAAIGKALAETGDDRASRRQRDIDRDQKIMLALAEKRRRMQGGGS